MTTTAALVTVTKNMVRYLVSIDATGGTATITASGAATPDLVTDTATVLGQPINKIARSGLDGIGSITAGTMTQAQARSLLMADDTSNAGTNVPKAKTTTVIRGNPNSATIGVDANVDGSARPEIVITAGGAGSGNTANAYVDIQLRHSIWL